VAITNDLAAALCGAPNARLTETRRAFTKGVAWITYSETVGVRDALATAGSGFGDDISGYRDVPSAADSLRRKLQALRCLLVVDNATVIEQVTPFANALGPDCRLLVTTRDASLAAGRRAVPVGVLDDAAASLHLADWADVKPDQLPPEALEVGRQCAGLPLVTAVCGAMVSQGTPWSDLLTKLEQADLAFLKAHFDYPHPTVLQCLKVSLDLLDPAERERYSELRIFDVTQPVPESVVVRLWTREGRMSPEDARELIKTLALRALLRIETNLAEIAAVMALAGETDAKDVFARAESVARTATDDWSTPEYIQTLALGAVASALVSCGWADEAWRVAESTERNRDGAGKRYGGRGGQAARRSHS